MDFSGKKDYIKSQLDNIYDRLKKDVSQCRKISNVKMFFENEKTRVQMIADAVENEITYDTSKELKHILSKNIVEEEVERLTENVGHIVINPMIVDYSKAYYVLKPEIKQGSNTKQSNRNINDVTLLMLGAGILIGGGVGLIFVSKNILIPIAGAAIGAAAGYGASSALKGDANSSTKTSNRASASMGGEMKKINEEYFVQIIDKRKKDMVRFFFSYVDKFEKEFNSMIVHNR